MKRYHHILAPVDFSTTCEKVVEHAMELAKFYDAQLTLLHSVQDTILISEPFGEPNMAVLNTELQEQWIEQAQTQMRLFAEKLALPPSVEQKVEVGFATDTILQFAEEHAIDLVVIGHSGKKGFLGLLGSTANAVVKSAKCNVLVVQTGKVT
jgi:universal stress protein A